MPVIYAYLLEEIRELKLEQFKDELAIERLKVFMDDTQDAKDWGDARGLLSIFDVKFPELLDPTKTGYELAKEYRALWARCVFMSFPGVKNEQLELLYREHALDVFEHLDDPRLIIDEQLALVSYSDVFASRLVVIAQALQNNRQRVGSNQIIRASGKIVPPEIDWWLTEYRGYIGPNVKRGAVEQASFLTKNKNVQALKPEERKLVTKIIQFIDYLFYPTFSSPSVNPSLHILQENARWRAIMMEREGTEPDGAPATPNPKPEIRNQKSMTPAVIPEKSATAAISTTPRTSPQPSPTLGEGVVGGGQVGVPVDRAKYWSEFVTLHTTDLQILVEQLKNGRVGREDVALLVRALVATGNIELLVSGQPMTAPNLAQVLHAVYAKAGATDSQGAKEAAHIGSLLKKAGKPEFLEMAYFDLSDNSFHWA